MHLGQFGIYRRKFIIKHCSDFILSFTFVSSTRMPQLYTQNSALKIVLLSALISNQTQVHFILFSFLCSVLFKSSQPYYTVALCIVGSIRNNNVRFHVFKTTQHRTTLYITVHFQTKRSAHKQPEKSFPIVVSSGNYNNDRPVWKGRRTNVNTIQCQLNFVIQQKIYGIRHGTRQNVSM